MALRVIGLDWSLPNTYEEATPLRIALQMWGWQGAGGVDLNPHFFNYPSFCFYLHFAVQGIAYVILKLTGQITSVADWQVLHLTNPTAMYVASRLVSVGFAVATVAFTYKLARSIGGKYVGLLAMALLACNPFHVARSQMIEVDVPLTFFVVLALYHTSRILARQRLRDYVLTGISIGLAASCKYTGALLLVPAIAAHLLARSGARDKPQARVIAFGTLAAILAFAFTSPYIILDWNGFQAGIAVEAEHMKLGHFGQGKTGTIPYYARSLSGEVAGAAGAITAAVGMFILLVRTRQQAAIVVAAFVLAYAITIGSWSMQASRYLLPILPPLLVFAAALPPLIYSRGRPSMRHSRKLGAIAVVLILLGSNAFDLKKRAQTIQHDTRTDAQQWIEDNVLPGSFILMESYGPDLVGPSLLLQLDPRLRQAVIEKLQGRAVFATQSLPMYQVRPERSSVFYELGLYPDADYVLTSSAVRGRYEAAPGNFGTQLDFYSELSKQFRVLREFPPRQADGIHLTLYQRNHMAASFSDRPTVSPPRELTRGPNEGTGREAGFYFDFGANFEYYHHPAEASAAYQLAIEYGTSNRNLFLQCVIGRVRCLLRLGRSQEAITFLRSLSASVEDESTSRLLAQMLNDLTQGRQ